MSSIAATEIQQEPQDQTTSSVFVNNFTADVVTSHLTVNRYVRDAEDLLKTPFYPGQPCALYITNNVAPEWLTKSQPVTLCSEYHGQPASASQQLVFIGSKIFAALRELATEHFKIEPTLHLIAVYSQSSLSGFLFVEVNDEAIPTGNVEPFYFALGKDFEWPLYVADITDEEWTKIKSGIIKLPSGWPRDPILIFHRAEVLKK